MLPSAMAGHSKWANIQHRKGAQDKRKAKIFSKCSKGIISAVKQGGGDPDMNLTLRYAIDKAKSANMPRDRIERAIQSALGGGPGQEFDHVVYEGYGPGGVAVMVESLTDNRNRTAPEIKRIFEKAGGNLGASGCVAHLFTRKALFGVALSQVDEDRITEVALECGAEDVRSEGDTWEISGSPDCFGAIRHALEEAEIPTLSSAVSFLPIMRVEVSDEEVAGRLLRMIEALDDHDDVSSVHSNFDIPEGVMEKLAGS